MKKLSPEQLKTKAEDYLKSESAERAGITGVCITEDGTIFEGTKRGHSFASSHAVSQRPALRVYLCGKVAEDIPEGVPTLGKSSSSKSSEKPSESKTDLEEAQASEITFDSVKADKAMTRKKLKEALDQKGVDYEGDSNRDTLIKMYVEAYA